MKYAVTFALLALLAACGVSEYNPCQATWECNAESEATPDATPGTPDATPGTPDATPDVAPDNGKGPQGNNGHGNGDQDAPGKSGGRNNAENSENSGQGNSGRGGGRDRE
jgi:hypothetical protein